MIYRWTGFPPEIWVFKLLKSVSSPMLKNATANRKVRMLPEIFKKSVNMDSPIIGKTTKEEIIERKAKPRINFGNRYQI